MKWGYSAYKVMLGYYVVKILKEKKNSHNTRFLTDTMMLINEIVDLWVVFVITKIDRMFMNYVPVAH